MLIAWLASSPTQGMGTWGISSLALAQGRYETTLFYMFAHGSAFHLIMNLAALFEIGGLVVVRLGDFPRGWVKFFAAFVLTGIAAEIFFLSLHPSGQVPLIGASGAVYGLLGLLLFIRVSEEFDYRLKLESIPQAAISFCRENWIFLAIIAAGAVLSGLSTQIAWEAHLGGFLFGACLGPWISPHLLEEPDE